MSCLLKVLHRTNITEKDLREQTTTGFGSSEKMAIVCKFGGRHCAV